MPEVSDLSRHFHLITTKSSLFPSQKSCPNCGPDSVFETDTTAGHVLYVNPLISPTIRMRADGHHRRCQTCGYIVESGILVSEVGFSEGAGGRVHVQGAFVSHHSSKLATGSQADLV